MRGSYALRKRRYITSGGRSAKRLRLMARASRFGSRRLLMGAGGLGVAAVAGYGAYRGIRRIKRARARGRARRAIGVSKPQSCKSVINVDTTVPGAFDLFLGAHDMTKLALGSGRDQRQTDVAFIKGFKIQMTISNLSASPAVYMLALVSPKTDYSGGILNNIENEFFREWGAERAQDWASNQDYTTLVNAPINIDKWTVLWKKRINLGGQRDGGFNKPVTYEPSDKEINQYIKLNRKMTYESGVGAVVTECPPVYLLRWGVRRFQQTGGTGQATFGIQLKCITFFSDPK